MLCVGIVRKARPARRSNSLNRAEAKPDQTAAVKGCGARARRDVQLRLGGMNVEINSHLAITSLTTQRHAVTALRDSPDAPKPRKTQGTTGSTAIDMYFEFDAWSR